MCDRYRARRRLLGTLQRACVAARVAHEFDQRSDEDQSWGRRLSHARLPRLHGLGVCRARSVHGALRPEPGVHPRAGRRLHHLWRRAWRRPIRLAQEIAATGRVITVRSPCFVSGCNCWACSLQCPASSVALALLGRHWSSNQLLVSFDRDYCFIAVRARRTAFVLAHAAVARAAGVAALTILIHAGPLRGAAPFSP